MKKIYALLIFSLVLAQISLFTMPVYATSPAIIDSKIDLPGLSVASYGEFLSFSEYYETLWDGDWFSGQTKKGKLLGWDTVDRIGGSNWNATPDVAGYYIDDSGNFCVVIAEYQPIYKYKTWNVTDADGSRTETVEEPEMTYVEKFWIYHYNQDYTLIGKKEIVTSEGFNIWGGFHAGSDGYFYIAVGRGNPESSETKTVMQILRYNHNWNFVGTASISGNPSRWTGGIAWPINAGNCSMLVENGILYVHTSRIMAYKTYAGHQASVSFSFNTDIMKETFDFSVGSYVSHSFQQLLASDGDYIYFLDQGDGYPRGLRLSICSTRPNSNSQSSQLDVFDFMGINGDNYTGTTVGAMETAQDSVLIAGSSEPHNKSGLGKTGFGSEFEQNIFLITVSKSGEDSRFRWITSYDPNGATSTETPRMVKIDDNTFALIYNIVENTGNDEKRTLQCVMLDGEGNETKRTSYPDVYFADSTKPIYHNGEIVWIQPKEKDLKYFISVSAKDEPLETATNYIFRLSLLGLDSASTWAKTDVAAAIRKGLVSPELQSNYTNATTRAEFCALGVSLYETVTGREITGRTTFTDTTDANVQKMASLGVVNGIGDNKFGPGNKLTREQAATMLSRLADAIGKPLSSQAPAFSDSSSISSWASDAVGQMQATGIMGGVGNNTFAPKSDYTREQSIITMMRMFNIVK